jgi:predicted nucleotidyltransferase
MTATSLDVSRKLDRVSIDRLVAVDSTAVALGVTYCIIGAFARDVMLGLCYGIDTGEATRDIDFGLMMDDWALFVELRRTREPCVSPLLKEDPFLLPRQPLSRS